MRFKLLFLTFSFLISLQLTAASLPFGTWRYTIYHEGEQVGTAEIKRSMQSRAITTSSELSFIIDETFTVSRETIQEEGNFTPLTYATESTFVTKDSAKRVSMKAEVKEETLHVTDGSRTLKFKLTDNLNFGSNILFASLLKAGLKPESSGVINMYDPSLSPTRTIKTKMVCHEIQKTNCGSKEIMLHKITVFHKDKKLYTFYCDNSGIIHKYVLAVNGQDLVLTLSSYDS